MASQTSFCPFFEFVGNDIDFDTYKTLHEWTKHNTMFHHWKTILSCSLSISLSLSLITKTSLIALPDVSGYRRLRFTVCWLFPGFLLAWKFQGRVMVSRFFFWGKHVPLRSEPFELWKMAQWANWAKTNNWSGTEFGTDPFSKWAVSTKEELENYILNFPLRLPSMRKTEKIRWLETRPATIEPSSKRDVNRIWVHPLKWQNRNVASSLNARWKILTFCIGRVHLAEDTRQKTPGPANHRAPFDRCIQKAN